jgi:hypothetical protein
MRRHPNRWPTSRILPEHAGMSCSPSRMQVIPLLTRFARGQDLLGLQEEPCGVGAHRGRMGEAGTLLLRQLLQTGARATQCAELCRKCSTCTYRPSTWGASLRWRCCMHLGCVLACHMVGLRAVGWLYEGMVVRGARSTRLAEQAPGLSST